MREDTETVMSAEGGSNIEVILVRMEGKIDRQGDRLTRYETDMTAIRTRLHELANEVQVFVGLGLPDRFRVIDMNKADHDARIDALEKIEQQRKGAAALAKVIYTVLGAAGVGGIAAVVRLLQIGGI